MIVTDQVRQSETVVTGDEVNVVGWKPPIINLQIAAAGYGGGYLSMMPRSPRKNLRITSR